MILRAFAISAALSTPAVAADRALVIGIDDYVSVDGAPLLNGAANDAESMAAVLTGPLGFPSDAVIRLTDSAATSDAILTTLIDRLVRETGPGDRVVLYFAGLGTVLPDGAPAVLAHDGASVLGQIPVETLAEILAVIPDRQITVILDAGFDGGPLGARGLSGAPPSEPVSFPPHVTAWTASEIGQFAWEVLDRGAFTAAFIDTLETADAGDDGELQNGELLAELQASLARWCDASAPCATSGRGLTPTFSGDPDGTLLIRAAPPARIDPDLPPIIADDGAPASFRETLGLVTDLFAPSNDAGLTLSIAGGDPLRIGGFVSFTASANRTGTLLLLDIDPTGRLAQVYPSRLSAADGTRLDPGRAITIPSAIGANGRPLRIRVTEPAGQGLLLGLFIEGDLPQLTALLPAGIAGGPVPDAGRSLFEISQSLLRLEANPDMPVAWSATYLPYRIEQ